MRPWLTYLFVLFHVPLRWHHSSAEAINEALLTSLRLITESVGSSYSNCNQVNILIESNIRPDISSPIASHVGFSSLPSVSVNLIVDLSILANSGEPPITFYYESRYNHKYHQPCTIIFYETSAELLNNAPQLNNATVGRRWPERILPLLPNEVARCFFVFFTTRSIGDDALVLPQMNDLMHETGMILHSLFLVPDNETSVVVFEGLPKSSLDLKYFTVISDGYHERILPQSFYMTTFDFNGETILSLFCHVCAPTPEELEQSVSVATVPTLAYVLLQKRFNMTPNPEKIFGIPTFGINEDDGSFDDFILPVVEGRAAITSLLVPSVYTYHVLLPTQPYFFDRVGFLTAPPKAIVDSGIYMIQKPLHWAVWIAVIVSSLSILACIEIILYNGNRMQLREAGIHAWLIQIVFKPLLEQSSFEFKEFRRRIRLYRVHCILGLWSLCLLVLECAYDSALLDVNAFPRLIRPPQTFKELAASDYEVGAILADKVQHDLKATNVTAYHNLAKRLIEHDFTDSSCFQFIFERNMACMGLLNAMNKLGGKFLIDIYGRRIGITSKDTHFFTTGASAVSKYYPMLYGPLNNYIGVFMSVGLNVYGQFIADMEDRKTGMNHAFENSHKKYYLGVETTSSESQGMNRHLVGIMAGILQYGGGVAFAAFVCEVSSYYFYDQVKTGVGVGSYEESTRPSSVPKIYVSDFGLAATVTRTARRFY